MKEIYVDMDGVLAKWNPAATIEETFERGYFLNREPQQNIIDAVNRLKGKYNITILSCVYQNGYATEEKIAWLKKNGLGDLDKLFVPYGASKREFIKELTTTGATTFLLDDYTKNLVEWEKEDNSVGIKFLNGINDTNKSWHGLRLSSDMDTNSIALMLDALFQAI